jgi:AcrR family transcriptional regulator
MVLGMEQMSSRRHRQAAIIDAVTGIVAERGLDHVSVREVAAAAGVSIGTVQHYFPTKQQMLAAAYTDAVRRIRARLEALQLDRDARGNLALVLRELLPLDDQRRVETRVYMAFAAAAATSPSLADIQQTILTELHTALTDAFAQAWGDTATPARCLLAAHAAIALADGLAFHAVTTTRWLPSRKLIATVDLVLEALLCR